MELRHDVQLIDPPEAEKPERRHHHYQAEGHTEGTELTPAQTERGNKLPKNHASMLGILDDAGSDGLTVEEWNDLARKEGLGVRRRMDLMDYRKALKKKKLVYEFDERWFISRG